MRRVKRWRREWILVVGVLLAGVTLACLLVLVPAGVRAMPGRYAARLPDFLQALRRQSHPETLPTPDGAFTSPQSEILTPTALRLSGVTFATATPWTGDVAVTPPATPLSTSQVSHTAVVPSLLATGELSAPIATPTLTPSATPTPLATTLPAQSPHLPSRAAPGDGRLPGSASLLPITHTYQTWNNCGPATLSMALAYWRRAETQADAAAVLKSDPEDKNVSPHEMVDYVRELGLEAMLRVGGDLTRLKRLIAAGLPVLVETWFIPEPGDQMGHYRLLTGYDDTAGHFIAHDSYNGPDVRLDYATFDELWRVFDRVYLVVYEADWAEQVTAILGEDVQDQAMYARALATAQAEAAEPEAECVAYEDCADGEAFAWFNVGSNLTALGRHPEAVVAYDQARLLGLPWRMLWYQFGPYESYYAVGRYEDVITLATVTLNVVDNLEESYYWRGRAFLAQENVDQARADFEAALKYRPNFAAAARALESLK